mmetsp:Transcript_76261/g.184478  ORF Transcript_76261/g.184478 Transcript_76261/m.184478 type:complete len:318 (-) Transcript_76261:158-1111(-)
MSPCAKWCSLVVVSPVVLLIALVGPLFTPYSFGSDHDGRSASLEADEADEAAAMQKFVARAEFEANETDGAGLPVRFIRNKLMLRELPKTPKQWPQVLRGVYWLDQRGSYGIGSVGKSSFDDLCISYGGSGVEFDPKTRIVTMKTSGSSWTWFNSADAYHTWKMCQKFQCGYDMHYNEDYSFAQIIPHAVLPVVGKVSVPIFVANFTMTTLYPKPGQCPPKKGATKKQISQCAAARRESHILKSMAGFSWLGGTGSTVYYSFQVGDGDHKPVQPYFDAYLAFADTTSVPDPASFKKEFGAPLPKAGKRKDVQMISTR